MCRQSRSSCKIFPCHSFCLLLPNKPKNPVFGAVSHQRGITQWYHFYSHQNLHSVHSADIATNIPRCNRRLRPELIAVISNVRCSVLPLQSHLPSALPHFLAASCDRAAKSLCKVSADVLSSSSCLCVSTFLRLAPNLRKIKRS